MKHWKKYKKWRKRENKIVRRELRRRGFGRIPAGSNTMIYVVTLPGVKWVRRPSDITDLNVYVNVYPKSIGSVTNEADVTFAAQPTALSVDRAVTNNLSGLLKRWVDGISGIGDE